MTKIWNVEQSQLLRDVIDDGLLIGGDARCDSRGHSAKYGSYTAVDLERSKVLNVGLVQSNQVKCSCNMELEGLQRMIQLFQRFQVKVRALVTDRPRQIEAWLKKNWQAVKHYFDCSHIAKSIKKKLKSLTKNIGDWTKSIINHYY